MKLKDYRQLAKMTREQFGALVGVTGVQVWRWEAGRSMPKPRIVDVEVQRGGYAGFVVTGIRGNGSPILRKVVRCSASGYRTRSAPIVAEGLALVSGLRRGTTYTCVAIVANEFGAQQSEKVRVKAR